MSLNFVSKNFKTSSDDMYIEYWEEDIGGNTIRQGLTKSWYVISGYKQKASECNYLNGQMHGECKTWHYNGNIMEHANYVNGVVHGVYKGWCKRGILRRHDFYVNGDLVCDCFGLTEKEIFLLYLKHGV